MTLRLIREAQVKSNLSSEKLRMLEVVKSALGKDSIVAVMENAYVPTPEEYAQWLDVIQGYATDSGVSLRRKNDFFDVAGAVLDNVDELPHSMHYDVMKKLWLDYQGQKHLKKIAGVAQAAEEEERVAKAARTMAGCEDEEFEDQLDGTTDDEAFQDSVERDTLPNADSTEEQAWWHDDEDDTDENAFPQFAERKYGDRPNELAGTPEDDQYTPDADDEDAFNANDDTDHRAAFENEEKTNKPRKQMSVLQQMLTLPKNSINSLVKDVESEGAAAWNQHVLPQNPHPKGSMAHKAWERGMTKAMKDHVGGGKEPTKSPTKKKTKR